MKLSKRLQAVVSLCSPCDCIVDIGTDHGYVPIDIANKGLSRHVIATDISEGPIKYCIKNKNKYMNNKNVFFETKKGEGLKVLEKGIKYGIIITGIGFDLLKDILFDIQNYMVEYMILSPQTRITDFIKYIDTINFKIIKNLTVFEDDKVYFIFKVVPKTNQ